MGLAAFCKLTFTKRSSTYYVSKRLSGWVGRSRKWPDLVAFSTPSIYVDILWVGGLEKVQNYADVI